MKIFINCATGLGNIILFLPSYGNLRKKHPTAEVTIGLDARFYADPFFKLQFGQDCNFVQIHSKQEGYLKYLFSFIKIRKFHFDVSFAAYNGNSIFNAMCLLFVGAKKTIYFKTNNRLIDSFFSPPLQIPANINHYIEINYLIVKELEAEFDVPEKWLLPENNFTNKTINKNTIYVGIHPGGNVDFNSARQWPKEYYKKLVEYILQRNNVIIIIFGKGAAENRLLDFIISKNMGKCIKTINNSLNEVSTILSKCDIFIGNDSSIMNMSVALNIPTLCIIGPTNPMQTGPYSNNHKCISLNLDCQPCFDTGYSDKCPHKNCLKKLSPEIVFNDVIEYLEKTEKNRKRVYNYEPTDTTT